MSEPSEMIERVAEAMLLAGLQTNPLYGETSIGPNEMDALRRVTRENRLQYAQAAVRAMREPTFDMTEAGQETNNLLENPNPPNAFKFLSRDEMTEAWKSMIDKALE